MKGVGLSSSPNWYCKCCDANQTGIFVFGTKNNIVILNVSLNPPAYDGIFSNHQERISSVVFCKDADSNHIVASSSEDGMIKVWDVTTKFILQECKFYQEKVSCMDWSFYEKDVIISADVKGQVISWNYKTNESHKARPQRGMIMCIACCPEDIRLVAFGYKDGHIIITDSSQNFNTVCRLKGHDDDIHCLEWAPAFKNKDIEKVIKKGNEGHLLASSSRDKTIRIWSTETGKTVYNFQLPNPVSYKNREQNDDQAKARAWTPLKWVQSDLLVSATRSGDLFQCNILEKSKNCWQVFRHKQGKTHSRIVFGISLASANTICTIGMDRLIMVWKLDSLEHQYTLPTLGGFVYALTFSPLDPGRLAIGVGDNMIRIWNLNSTVSAYDIITLWQGIKAKVTALSWHPSKEGWLAYGTEDGRIGIYDVLSNKAPLVSSTYHKGMVYTVAWGPCCSLSGSGADIYNLYSCGDGIILQHNPRNLKNSATDLNNIIKGSNDLSISFPNRTEISWKPDGTVVAVGNEDGSIEIFHPPCLKRVCILQIHHKLIHCIQWHPVFTASAIEPSSCEFMLASGSNEFTVHVTDLKNILGYYLDVSKCVTITESSYRLYGLRGRITKVSWSPHMDGKLAAASYDGTAQVWDVLSGQPLANFRGHQGRLFSIAWSPLNVNVVFSGGEDYCVHQWDISAQEFILPPKADKSRNRLQKKSKGKQQPQEIIDNDASGITLGQYFQQQLDKKRLELLSEDKSIAASAASFSSVEDAPLENIDTITKDGSDNDENTSKAGNFPQKKGLKDKLKKKKRSLFPESCVMENRGKSFLHEDIRFLSDQCCLSQDTMVKTTLPNHLGLFGNRISTYHLLQAEGDHHLSNNQWDLSLQLDVWKGNIDGALNSATENGQLSDWLVAMAPLASYEIWQKTCENYAKQLVKEGSYHRAVLYFLTCGKVYEAIEMLQNQGLYRDAVTLAKLRLSPKDPVLFNLYKIWANNLIKENNLEQAAKCYLALKDPVSAAKLLVRRCDPTSLQTAAYLFQMSSHPDDAVQYARQSIREYLYKGDWSSAFHAIQDLVGIQEWNLVISTHELLIKELLSYGVCSSHMFENAQSSKFFDNWQSISHKNDDAKEWKPHLVEGEAFLVLLSKIWTQHQWSSKEKASTYYSRLKENQAGKRNISNLQDILFQCSVDLTLSLLAFDLKHIKEGMCYLVNSLHICNQANQPDILENICQLILPFGPENLDLSLPVTCSLQSTVLKTAETNSDVIFSSGICFQEVDYLKAYYSLAQILHLSKPDQICKALSESDSSDSLSKIVDTEKSGTDTIKADKDKLADWIENKFEQAKIESSADMESQIDCQIVNLNSKAVNASETVRLLKTLAKYLLWDIQAQKSSLQLRLSHIVNRIAILSTQNKNLENNTKFESSITDISSISFSSSSNLLKKSTTATKEPKFPNEATEPNDAIEIKEQSIKLQDYNETKEPSDIKTIKNNDHNETEKNKYTNLIKDCKDNVIKEPKDINETKLQDVNESIEPDSSDETNSIKDTNENEELEDTNEMKELRDTKETKDSVYIKESEYLLVETESPLHLCNESETNNINHCKNISKESVQNLEEFNLCNQYSSESNHKTDDLKNNEVELILYKNMLKYLDDLFQAVLTSEHPQVPDQTVFTLALEDLYSTNWLTLDALIEEQQKIRQQLNLINSAIVLGETLWKRQLDWKRLTFFQISRLKNTIEFVPGLYIHHIEEYFHY